MRNRGFTGANLAGSGKRLRKGLPDADGTTVSAIIANPKEMGTFYAANNTGIYVSEDKGASWEALPVPWNDSFRAQNVRTFAGWF